MPKEQVRKDLFPPYMRLSTSLFVLAGLLFGWMPLTAGPYEYPYGATIDRVIRDGDRGGWGHVARALRNELFRAHERDTEHVEPLFLLYRWADLFATHQATHTQRWIMAIEAARLGHTNMPREYELVEEPLGDLFDAATKRRLLTEHAFSRALFETLTPFDNPVIVLDILARIAEAEPRRFEQYGELAIAIAVVYDVPPPPDWPHYQVTEAMLPRQLPDPVEAFQYFADLRDQRLADIDLAALPTEVLKFVVDTPASFADLDWARENVRQPHEYFEDVYSTIEYQHGRVETQHYVWGDPAYTLPHIQEFGGICVDQAYYSAQAGKARGIPTVLFTGANRDGRHAWFGYRKPDGSWMFDAGRLGSNAFVTGVAIDPQTWDTINDHQLQFLTERFHQSTYYRHSRLQTWIADLYRRSGRLNLAIETAEDAVRYEPRNASAWEMLLIVRKAAHAKPEEIEETLRRAAQAFRSMPDLEAAWREQLIDHLQRHDEPLRADRERQLLAAKNQGSRSDITIRQATAAMQESVAKDPMADQMRTYRTLLARHGATGGAPLLDGVVKPFLLHLVRNQELTQANLAIKEARRQLKAPAGSQLSRELADLDRILRGY